jgi:hypothetical protein
MGMRTVRNWERSERSLTGWGGKGGRRLTGGMQSLKMTTNFKTKGGYVFKHKNVRGWDLKGLSLLGYGSDNHEFYNYFKEICK